MSIPIEGRDQLALRFGVLLVSDWRRTGMRATPTEADKIIFMSYQGSEKKIIAVLDSDGHLQIAGRLIAEQKDLSY